MNFKTFNSKLAGLPRSKKILLLFSIAVLFGVFWNFVVARPSLEKISTMKTELTKLQHDLQEVTKVSKNADAFQQEVEKVRQEFLLAQIQLPTEKEIPSLLAKISDLGNNVGLEFKLFKPQAEVDKEFYCQLPIDIKVRGPYHNVANFFRSISALDRIVNIEDFTMENPQLVSGLVTLETTCVATTYRFNANTPHDQADASKKGKKKENKNAEKEKE